MGSLDISEDELTVLPFKELYPRNPSWEIASSLPEYLPPERAKDVAARRSSAAATAAALPKVRILVHPEPIRVNYEVVRGLVPKLWESPQRKIDFALHIGMAGPQPVYSLERLAHRDGYRLKDVDGNFLGDEERREKEGDKWVWNDTPTELTTELDIKEIYKSWVERSPKTEGTALRISDDPGRYMCDFIYFSSLAHLWKQQKPRKLLFLHVPAGSSPEGVDLGRELVLQLIRSIAESEVSRRSA
ncbi:putative pyroglutamyl peptidase type protein [Eutypa lata UCREL1]|uniref:Putative pyroglutamyl peptidase type protein n=1 Tax=Eutypa lata (strain UCR-EL1) TaxID=1287681 RepID=M7T2D0_EUTLA|nr:putative pyroglutamyl peptidase type protein [Eutypa lata UCREL1]